jgi:hypothetical protein
MQFLIKRFKLFQELSEIFLEGIALIGRSPIVTSVTVTFNTDKMEIDVNV